MLRITGKNLICLCLMWWGVFTLGGCGAWGGEAQKAQVPVLIYHNISADEADGTLTPERLDAQLSALANAGYTTISFDELEDFVEGEGTLPEKPIIFTFDDGYESNYRLAYPVFQKHNAKATIFVIGVSVGKTTYKDTGKKMTPHFTLEEAEEMEASGLISIQSHGYNLHEVKGYDQEPIRRGAQQREDESEEEYRAFLKQDFETMKEVMGKTCTVLAYPYGLSSRESEEAATEAGIKVTLSIDPKVSTVTRGDPQSMRLMGRINAESLSPEELIEKLDAAKEESRRSK